MKHRVRLLLFAAGIALPPSGTAAQVRASEAATISQTVDGTVITVSYSRPQARGRDSLFGDLVRYGQMWTPGANRATTLEVSKDVRLNGHPVPEGTYSIWMIPDERGWIVVLDPDAQRFHTQRPGTSDDQIRFPVQPDSGGHREVLTWDFPVVRPDGATLRLRWGSVAILLDVDVEPTGRGRRATAGEAYAGTYAFRFLVGSESRVHRVDVFEDEEVLQMRLTPNPFPDHPAVVALKGTKAAHVFEPAFAQRGRPYDVEAGAQLVFTVHAGRATGLELRGIRGRVLATGRRVE